MDDALAALDCGEFDLDQLGVTMLAAYDAQQALYIERNTFSLLSLISMALLELGVLVEEEEKATNHMKSEENLERMGAL